MTTTDTRAALDAAIDRIADVWTSFMRTREVHPTAPIELADWMAPKTLTDPLRTAITAHVEAEVTRRLAVAPSVDDALAAYGTAVYELGYVLHRPDRDAVLRPVKDVAEATLRAAIAADRERAVEVARLSAQIHARAAVIDALMGGEDAPARPTPDEARRLVEEYGNAVVACIPAIEAGARGDGDAVNAMADVIDRGNKTLAALLRALGVEA